MKNKISVIASSFLLLVVLIIVLLIQSNNLKSQVQVLTENLETSLIYDIAELHGHLYILNSNNINEDILNYVEFNINHTASSIRQFTNHYDLDNNTENLPETLFDLQYNLREMDLEQIKNTDISDELNSIIQLIKQEDGTVRDNNELINNMTNLVNTINQKYLVN